MQPVYLKLSTALLLAVALTACGPAAEKPSPLSSTKDGIQVSVEPYLTEDGTYVLGVTCQDTDGRARIDGTSIFNCQPSQSGADLDYTFLNAPKFDEESGTLRYDVCFTRSESDPDAPISLSVYDLCYGMTKVEIPLSLDLAAAVADGEHIGEPSTDEHKIPDGFLTPGHLCDIPGVPEQWLSAVGTSDGYLTIQYSRAKVPPNVLQVGPYVLDADGNKLERMSFASGRYVDEDLNPASIDEWAYELREYYYRIDDDTLDGYSIGFSGSKWEMFDQSWEFEVPVSKFLQE